MNAVSGILLVVALLPTVAFALLPAAIGYQGKLEIVNDPTGKETLGKPVELRFYLYRDETGGIPVWGRSISVTPDKEGNFATVLSDDAGTELLENAPALGAVLAGGGVGQPLWLTFAAGRAESPELAPRQRILPLARAHAARSAEKGANGFTVSGTLTAYTFEVTGETTFSQPVRCRTLTVTDASGTLEVPNSLRLEGGLSLTGGALKSGRGVVLGPKTTGGSFFPIGAIVMWSGEAATIPEGWALCDGSNGTPDLRERFLYGKGSNLTVGQTGGAVTVTLTENELPSHAHNLTYDIAPDRNVDLFWLSRGSENDDERTWRSDTTRQTTTNSMPATEPHENRPPYYALCFIQRIR